MRGSELEANLAMARPYTQVEAKEPNTPIDKGFRENFALNHIRIPRELGLRV